jgi:hypothetical protein
MPAHPSGGTRACVALTMSFQQPFCEPLGPNFHPQFVPSNFIAFEQPASRLLLRRSRLEIFSNF